MCSCRQFCRWLPVFFVLALIGWCYFIFTYDILALLLNNPPAAVGTRSQGVAYTIAFNSIFALGMIAFVRAVFTDPGRIPDSWIVGAEDTEAGSFIPQLHTLEVKHDGTRRICRKSKPNVYKPDRAHFCKMLGRCVLKMDHFCPWLNNCIGFYNHKYFYLFIFYMAVLTVFMLVAMTPVFVHDVSSMEVRTSLRQPHSTLLFLHILFTLPSALLLFFSTGRRDRLHKGVPRDPHLPRPLPPHRRPRLLLGLPHLPTRLQLHDHRVSGEARVQPAARSH